MSASAAGEAGVSSGGLTMIEQPVARAAPILRTACETGKFHGVNAATGPTGSFTTSWQTPSARAGTMRP